MKHIFNIVILLFLTACSSINSRTEFENELKEFSDLRYDYYVFNNYSCDNPKFLNKGNKISSKVDFLYLQNISQLFDLQSSLYYAINGEKVHESESMYYSVFKFYQNRNKLDKHEFYCNHEYLLNHFNITEQNDEYYLYVENIEKSVCNLINGDYLTIYILNLEDSFITMDLKRQGYTCFYNVKKNNYVYLYHISN